MRLAARAWKSSIMNPPSPPPSPETVERTLSACLVLCICTFVKLCIGIFGAMYVYALLVCYALASLVCWIVGALQLWWIISWLQYFFCVLYLRSLASLVLSICTFCMLCILHRHLWWCLVGAITIVQCIFGALFLGLGCNIFLVLRLWGMHCQRHCAGLLPQWRIYFILSVYF